MVLAKGTKLNKIDEY